MTEYVVLLPGDEAEWEAASEERRQATYLQHQEFAKLLEERGHRVTGGAELAHSREAKVLRTDADGAPQRHRRPVRRERRAADRLLRHRHQRPRRPARGLQGAWQGRGRDRGPRVQGRHLVMKFLVLMAEEDTWNRWNALSDGEQRRSSTGSPPSRRRWRSAARSSPARRWTGRSWPARSGPGLTGRSPRGRSPRRSSSWAASGWSTCPTSTPRSRRRGCCPRRTASRCARSSTWASDPGPIG